MVKTINRVACAGVLVAAVGPTNVTSGVNSDVCFGVTGDYSGAENKGTYYFSAKDGSQDCKAILNGENRCSGVPYTQVHTTTALPDANGNVDKTPVNLENLFSNTAFQSRMSTRSSSGSTTNGEALSYSQANSASNNSPANFWLLGSGSEYISKGYSGDTLGKFSPLIPGVENPTDWVWSPRQGDSSLVNIALTASATGSAWTEVNQNSMKYVVFSQVLECSGNNVIKVDGAQLSSLEENKMKPMTSSTTVTLGNLNMDFGGDFRAGTYANLNSPLPQPQFKDISAIQSYYYRNGSQMVVDTFVPLSAGGDNGMAVMSKQGSCLCNLKNTETSNGRSLADGGKVTCKTINANSANGLLNASFGAVFLVVLFATN